MLYCLVAVLFMQGEAIIRSPAKMMAYGATAAAVVLWELIWKKFKRFVI